MQEKIISLPTREKQLAVHAYSNCVIFLQTLNKSTRKVHLPSLNLLIELPLLSWFSLEMLNASRTLGTCVLSYEVTQKFIGGISRDLGISTKKYINYAWTKDWT